MCLVREFCGVCFSCNAIQMRCKKIKVSITARDKVLDPEWWTNSKMFVSCLCCNIHHLVDPVLQKAGFVCRNSWRFWCGAVACLVPIACNHNNLITGALKFHASNTFTSDTRRISNVLLSNVIYTNTCHLHPCSWEIFYFLYHDVRSFPKRLRRLPKIHTGCACHPLMCCIQQFVWYILPYQSEQQPSNHDNHSSR